MLGLVHYGEMMVIILGLVHSVRIEVVCALRLVHSVRCGATVDAIVQLQTLRHGSASGRQHNTKHKNKFSDFVFLDFKVGFKTAFSFPLFFAFACGVGVGMGVGQFYCGCHWKFTGKT